MNFGFFAPFLFLGWVILDSDVFAGTLLSKGGREGNESGK
jgi:hypothetical protein